MGRLAVVLGSNATGPGSRAPAGGGRRPRAPRCCSATAASGGSYVPPHRIDHAANLRSLRAAGCDRVLAICSVGSLKEEIAVGTPRLPRRLHRPAARDHDLRRRPRPHAAGLRPRVARAGPGRLAAGGAAALEDGGVYWQTTGPRFETPAEIRLLAAHADLVGMTMASECIVAGELGLAYAAICVVDNLANGIGAAPLERRGARGRPRRERRRASRGALDGAAAGAGAVSAEPAASPSPTPPSTASRSACAARTGRIVALGPGRRRRARRRDDRRRRRPAGRRRWSTATPTRR